jgi:hypothetical protein
VIIRNYKHFETATEPTERKGRPLDANRSGSSDDPNPTTRLQPGKRMQIREVRGRLEAVECE